MSKTDVYQLVTDRIISLLEKGEIPWRKTWAGGAGLGSHKNLVSGKAYRGINALITASSGYATPYWLTYKQASDHGGHVRKGEKGTPIVYWHFGEKETKNGETERYAFVKHSIVFNLEQVDGMDSVKDLIARPEKGHEFSSIELCEKLLEGYRIRGPVLEHKQQQAYYSPRQDVVNMPKQDSFESSEAYYAVLFHELVHSTGHESRLKRPGVVDLNFFGSHAYSKEELVAEMGAAFLCAMGEIDNTDSIEQSAAYIKSWLKQLRNDKKLVVQAASQAQKAVDLITNQDKKTEKK